MDLLSLATAVVWVDFCTIGLSKIFRLGASLDKWYEKYGMTAVLSDCLIIVLGILVAKYFFPKAELRHFILIAIGIQVVHDFLFYSFVISPMPIGHNSIIDLFKEYSMENSYKIIVADGIMIAATILLADRLERVKKEFVTFGGLLGVYALTYIVYTH
jgi:uncharacterized protein YacL